MFREPIVVVVQVCDVFALGALQRQMSIAGASLLVFWEIEHPKSLICTSQLSGDKTSRSVHPIADDEYLNIGLRLRERAASSDAQEICMVVGRNDHCEERRLRRTRSVEQPPARAQQSEWEPSQTLPRPHTNFFFASCGLSPLTQCGLDFREIMRKA